MYGHLAYDKSGERMGFAINGAETVGYSLALSFIHRMKGTELVFFEWQNVKKKKKCSE